MAKDTNSNSGQTQNQQPDYAEIERKTRREEVALSFATALLFRKDGSGTGTGIMNQAFTYADAFLAKAKGDY